MTRTDDATPGDSTSTTANQDPQDSEVELTPTEDLIMEVLAARWRGGDREWPFPSCHRPALRRLDSRGLATWRSGTVSNSLLVSLTEKGQALVLNPSYLADVEWFRPTAVPELRRRIDAVMRREAERTYPQDPRAYVATPQGDLWQSLVDVGDVPVLERFLDALRRAGWTSGADDQDRLGADRRLIAEFVGVDSSEMHREEERQQAALERYPDPWPQPQPQP